MTVPLTFADTYPLDQDFWVAVEQAHEVPLRYGDVFRTPALDQCRDGKKRLWRAVMAVHPSCEMSTKGAPSGVMAAMSHDARVALLRRDAYFRYRWPLTLQAVATLERDRIVGDSAFAGPRPDWVR